MTWPDQLEQFLGRYPHLITALEAASTFAAVAISLCLAVASWRGRKTRLRARVHKSLLIIGELKRTYVTINIMNTGLFPLRIPLSFFLLKIPFRKITWAMMVLDAFDTIHPVPKRKYPIEIPPRASEIFYIGDITTFRPSLYQQVKKTKGLTRTLFKFVRVIVVTDDGRYFTAKVDKDVREEFKAIAEERLLPVET